MLASHNGSYRKCKTDTKIRAQLPDCNYTSRGTALQGVLFFHVSHPSVALFRTAITHLMSHVLLFLGSGVSRPSGMPLVDGLTEAVFKTPMIPANGVYFEPRSKDELRDARQNLVPPLDKTLHKLRCFLRNLQDSISHHSDQEQVTYEDLYHSCQKIRQGIDGSNPVAHDFAIRLAGSLVAGNRKSCLLDASNGYNVENDLDHTADQAIRLIQGVVNSKLDDENCNIQGLQLVREVIEDPDIDRVTIATLNHDRLVERFLEGDNSQSWTHPYEDGFSNAQGEVRVYRPGQIFMSNTEVRIIKPHGSVDWFLAEKENPKPQTKKRRKYVKHSDPTKKRKYQLSGTNRYTYTIIGAGPFFLTGQGKQYQYGDDIIGDMTHALTDSLSNADTILVSGFGWSDRVMSHHLINSLRWGKDKNMILLYEFGENGQSLYDRDEYPYLANILLNIDREDVSAGQIYYDLKSYMCNADWNDVKPLI